jgi:hypothetical protein
MLTLSSGQMAEVGQTGALNSEVNRSISAGMSAKVLLGLDLDPTPGSTSFTFDIDENHPIVTLVIMTAPSPDWFVGVAGVNLFEGEDWASTATFTLKPWDAGTDGGSTYVLEDQATDPPLRKHRRNLRWASFDPIARDVYF